MTEIFSTKFPYSNYLKDKETINVKFLSGTIGFNYHFFINPNYWILKSWYKRHGKNNDKINWLPSIHCNVGLNEDKIKEIIETEKPNVICFGLYIWNYDLYSRLGKFIKNNYPDIILVGGGPNVYAHKELNLFWENNPWLDIAVYGDGEEAFTTAIDNMIDCSTANSTATNLSYIKDNVPVIEPFKRFKNAEFNFVSPFTDNLEDLTFAINQAKQIDPNFIIFFNWEFTKGCPYSCSFCDWSSGLHHKVTRKQYDWKNDLDLFASLGITVRWVDANVGMFKDDINIIKYAYELENTHKDFKFEFVNLAKLHKKAVFEIIDYIETAKPGRKIHNLAIQDINETVLENIDRPDVPWDQYKQYIIDTKTKHSTFNFDLEIMLGLPGQSLEGFKNNIIEYINLRPRQILSHIWCMLINSPGYNIDYRKKYQLRVEPALHITNFPKEFKTRDDIVKNIDLCEYYAAETVVSSNTASLSDIMAMYGMVNFYNNLNKYHKIIDTKLMIKVISNLDYWQNFGNKLSEILENDLTSRQKILLLPELNGIPVTFTDYFDNKTNLIQIIKQAT